MIRFDAWCARSCDVFRATSGDVGSAPGARREPRRERLGSSQKLRSMARPASPDFSGWNCRPKIAPRSTTLANVFGPVDVVAAVASPIGAANECVK